MEIMHQTDIRKVGVIIIFVKLVEFLFLLSIMGKQANTL